MALHQLTHPEPVDGCFGCKVIGLSFGIVPGGAREALSTSMFDRDAFLDQFGDSEGSLFSEERVRDNQSTAVRKLKEWDDIG